jgi:hypothetical protein
LHYNRNPLLLVVALCALAVAVTNYFLFFDVLSPQVGGGGSIKANMGVFFLLPVLLLTTIQVSYSAGLLHLVTRSFYFAKRDFLRAFFASSILVLLYSGYYVLVPSWGPYTFLTGAFRGVSSEVYVVLSLWTALIVVATTLLIRRVYRFKKGEIRWSVLVLVASSLFLIVMAFAEG